jgi:hypothetical protein
VIHKSHSRRRIIGALVALPLFFAWGASGADEIPVPLDLQAQLLSKVLTYDRSLASRAGDRVRMLLVGKPSDPTSMPGIRQMRQALGALDTLGGMQHEEDVIEFTTPANLAERTKNGRFSVVYLGSGFHGDVENIRAALEPFAVLTVSANPEDVSRGIVLGFDLVSGRPKLVLHLTQGRKQRIDLSSDALKLMRIIE